MSVDLHAIEIVRAAADEDLTEISALQTRTFTNPWSAESMRWELANTDVARLYVMRCEGRVIGYCACWLLFDEWHINSIAIDPDWRRHGLGSHLLRVVGRELVAAGATMATLEVRRSNVAALTLYNRLGFAVEAVRKDYYEHPREDALVLWCRRLAEV